MPNQAATDLQIQRTAKLMRDKLWIERGDALKILDNFSHVEIKVFAAGIPTMVEYIDFLATGPSDYYIAPDRMSRSDIKHLREPVDLSEFPGIMVTNPPAFTPEFRNLFATNLPTLLVNKLSVLLNIKEILRQNFKKDHTTTETIMTAIKPEAISQFYDYLANGARRIVELLNSDKKKPENYDELSAMLTSVGNYMQKLFAQIPVEVHEQLFNRDYIFMYSEGDQALRDILFVEENDRIDILAQWTPINAAKLHYIPRMLRENVLDQLQYPEGQNRVELVQSVFALNSKYPGDDQENFQDVSRSVDRYLVPRMVSPKFMSIINNIPKVLGQDEHGRKLSHDAFDRNNMAIFDAYDTLATGNNLTDALLSQFESLPAYTPPPPPAAPWINPNHTIPVYIVGAAAFSIVAVVGTAYLYDSLRRQVGFWTRLIGLNAREENKAIVNHLTSLPSSKAISFLSPAEISKYEEYLNKLADKNMKEESEKELQRYEHFIKNADCIFTLNSPETLKDPLLIEGILIEPKTEAETLLDNDSEYVNVRKWSYVYDYRSFLNYVARVSRNVLVPQTNDLMILGDSEKVSMSYKRGFPDHIVEFVEKVRVVNKEISRSLIANSVFKPDNHIAIGVAANQSEPRKGKRM